MKVKELKELLTNYPDDMEVMVYEEVGGPSPISTPAQEELWLIHGHEWNGRPYEWELWSYPSPYELRNVELIKKEQCLIFM